MYMSFSEVSSGFLFAVSGDRVLGRELGWVGWGYGGYGLEFYWLLDAGRPVR